MNSSQIFFPEALPGFSARKKSKPADGNGVHGYPPSLLAPRGRAFGDRLVTSSRNVSKPLSPSLHHLGIHLALPFPIKKEKAPKCQRDLFHSAAPLMTSPRSPTQCPGGDWVANSDKTYDWVAESPISWPFGGVAGAGIKSLPPGGCGIRVHVLVGGGSSFTLPLPCFVSSTIPGRSSRGTEYCGSLPP